MRRAWVEQVMGLPVSVHVRGPDVHTTDVEDGVGRVYAELRDVDAMLSPYRDDSGLSRWERGEIEVPATLAEVMALCDEAWARTGGWFDPRGLPDPRTGQPRYDPSGLVKGWAAQRAARHLAALAGHGWFLNAGGDVVSQAPAGQPPWRIGIEDPLDPGRLIQVVTGAAVATSGIAHRGAHIMDPYRRRPATAVAGVTVVGPDLTWADVYATAAAARGPSAMGWLSELDGYEAILIDRWGQPRTTDGWSTAIEP